jgi:hypothetical protein
MGMENAPQQTWKPVTAGILNIISGAIRGFGIIGLIIAISLIDAGHYFGAVPPSDAPFVLSVVNTVLVFALIISVVLTVLPIVGGVFALQRRRWEWALAGSVAAIIGVFPLGILSTVFVAMGKEEFE